MNSKIVFVAAAAALAGSAAFATDLGASVYVPNYGRIDIGRVPTPPVLVYPQPIVVAPQPVAVQQQPLYLHVPPGHAKKWSKHCQSYNACGQPVYFVREDWYQQNYVRQNVVQPNVVQQQVVRGDDRDDRKYDKHEKKHHGKGHGKHDD